MMEKLHHERRKSFKNLLTYGNPEYLIVQKSGLEGLLAKDTYVVLDEVEICRCLRAVEF